MTQKYCNNYIQAMTENCNCAAQSFFLVLSLFQDYFNRYISFLYVTTAIMT